MRILQSLFIPRRYHYFWKLFRAGSSARRLGGVRVQTSAHLQCRRSNPAGRANVVARAHRGPDRRGWDTRRLDVSTCRTRPPHCHATAAEIFRGGRYILRPSGVANHLPKQHRPAGREWHHPRTLQSVDPQSGTRHQRTSERGSSGREMRTSQRRNGQRNDRMVTRLPIKARAARRSSAC